ASLQLTVSVVFTAKIELSEQPPMTSPRATISFTSCNRRELLRQAIEAARRQTVPVEILVVDDASTDGTSEMMASEFPDIPFYSSERSYGPVYQRNQSVHHAS